MFYLVLIPRIFHSPPLPPPHSFSRGMSIVGNQCLIFTVEGQLRPAIIRASNRPLYKGSTTDLSQAKVLIEWSEGEVQRVWLELDSADKFQAVFVEDRLVWAKRVAQQRAVAWPAKSFSFFCGNLSLFIDTLMVEYLLDKERSELHISEIKDLLISEAQMTLSQNPQMIAELNQWEEEKRNREMLTSGTTTLNGRRVNVCSTQGNKDWMSGVVIQRDTINGELVVLEDGTNCSHGINPLTVQVCLQNSGEGRKPSALEQTLMNSNQAQQHWGGGSPYSGSPPNPHASPRHSNSAHNSTGSIPDALSSHLKPPFGGVYRTPSGDISHMAGGGGLHQYIKPTIMHSAPNLSRRWSMEVPALQQHGGRHFELKHDPSSAVPTIGGGGGGGGSFQPLVHTLVVPHSSPRSSPHPSPGSAPSSKMCDGLLTSAHSTTSLSTFPSAESMFRTERSKSTGNINLQAQAVQSPLHKRRHSEFVSEGLLLGGSPSDSLLLGGSPGSDKSRATKRSRVGFLPSIPDPQDLSPPNKCLNRSYSIPAICLPKSRQQSQLMGNAHSLGVSHTLHEDDLDMIQSIIQRDDQLAPDTTMLRSQSVSDIPGAFSSNIGATSLPILHKPSNLHLASSFRSAPNFMRLEAPGNRTPLRGSPLSDVTRLQDQSNGGGSLHASVGGDFPNHLSHNNSNNSCQFSPNSSSQAFGGRPYGGSTLSHMSHPPNLQDMYNYPLRQAASSSYTPSITSDSFKFTQSDCSIPISTAGPFPYLSGSTTPTSCAEFEPLGHTKMVMGTSGNQLLLPPGGGGGGGGEHVSLLGPSSMFRGDMYCGKDSAHIAGDAEPLSSPGDITETHTGELPISRVVNPQHVANGNESSELDFLSEEGHLYSGPSISSPLSLLDGQFSSQSSSPNPEKKTKKLSTSSQKEKSGQSKRGRGRPRLPEEEKLRRKELRDLGLMKRSKRRTKEEVAQWRAQKVLTPAKRGRKPGSGKKHIIRAATGKVVYVSVDLSQYANGTVFLQNGFCKAFPGVPKCLECATCEGDLPLNRYCRFLEFRKLRVDDNSQPVVSVEGFATYCDTCAEDLVPWTPLKAGYSRIDEDMAVMVISNTMPQFIDILTEEASMLPEEDVLPVWKRAVKGLRELCDTCDTTLFNLHWVCNNCGFCICPTCYQSYSSDEGHDTVSSVQSSWPLCVYNNQPHRPSTLLLTQIIPANVLAEVVSQALRICEIHRIAIKVPRSIYHLLNIMNRQEPQSRFQNESKRSRGSIKNRQQQMQSWMLEDYLTNPCTSELPAAHVPDELHLELPHSCTNGGEAPYDITSIKAPHLWLSNSTLLCLLDPTCQDSLSVFQHHWRRGRPVMVARVHEHFNKALWNPSSFENDFGNELADLVDCRLGLVLPQMLSKVFWKGFEDETARMVDPTTGEQRLLKLKDWPTKEDFSEKLPERFEDLMKALPLSEYTRRDGKLNLVSSLPEFFAKPDLGPKMYCAYGSASESSCGTTNLHIDISDAVNVMMYSNVPPASQEMECQALMDTLRKECCPETLRRIHEHALQVGAIWHIYAASDADKIRLLLKKVLEERGIIHPYGTDPIHDQLVYMDMEIRTRLYEEYGVKGWTIAQCVGDAIFIPAGAPHQVRNISSCIKVAEDFVSPEHIYECLKLTGEFRQLSERHANHEDKLQVKNIIYHSVKDIVGILKAPSK